jgi:hypothetical protein
VRLLVRPMRLASSSDAPTADVLRICSHVDEKHGEAVR